VGFELVGFVNWGRRIDDVTPVPHDTTRKPGGHGEEIIVFSNSI